MAQMPRCRVEVAWETPPRTRPAPEEWTRVDDALAEELDEHNPTLRALTVRRGAPAKIPDVEAGDATAVIDNRSRALDPANASSPWAPNVRPRRRIRFVLELEDDSELPLFTGFIERLPIGWEVGDGWVEVTATDLLGLVAGDVLPPSVFHEVILSTGPTHYWPLNEEVGNVAEDLAGTDDARYVADDPSPVTIAPYAPGGASFRYASSANLNQQQVAARRIALGESWAVALWFRSRERFVYPPTSGTDPHRVFEYRAPNGDYVFIEVDQFDGYPRIEMRNGAGTRRRYWRAGYWGDGGEELDLLDSRPHLLVFCADASTNRATISVDGRRRDVVMTTNTGAWPAMTAAGVVNIGTQVFPRYLPSLVGDMSAEWEVGHVATWDRVLTEDEERELWQAGCAPWDGDRTDERVARLLDLAGIDPGDRDLEPGSTLCAPARLDGGNLLEELRRVVATEPGGVLFVDGDGRIAFRQAIPNEPEPDAVFVGDPAVDEGIPYVDLEPDFSLDRIVNVADVTRPNGVTHRTRNADSVEEYGPLAVHLEGLHRTPAGARGAGARLTNRYRDPRTVIGSLLLNLRSSDVADEDVAGLELNRPVQVIARPTGPGDPIEQLSAVERLEHSLDWRAKTWELSLGLAEHVVLPPLEWDTPGRGWDQSVWPDT